MRPHGAKTASQWITTRNCKPDFIATYDSVGNESDKQWITIDTNPSGPHFNRIYAMLVNSTSSCQFRVSYADALPDGTHTAWSMPQVLPEPAHTATGGTYQLPHVDPAGAIYTTVTNFDPSHSYCCSSIFMDKSPDGGQTFNTIGPTVS